MQRYKISIEYLGTKYSGWQRQENAVSIQELIEDAIFSLSSEFVSIKASGRTDKGVHAINQIAHFDLNKNFDSHTIVKALNFYLRNQDIVITDCEKVSFEFDARFSAKYRSYMYKIFNSKKDTILKKDRFWHYKKHDLNEKIMQEAANYIIGKHDFSSFRASGCQSNSPVKTVTEITISKYYDEIEIYIKAKSFLYHMVRNIVGTLVDVGSNKISPDDFKNILESKNRSQAGITAPACGLYFYNTEY